MRVLGAEATADPTAVEREVRLQMEERAAAHEDRNLARKLTPAERRDKKVLRTSPPPPPPPSLFKPFRLIFLCDLFPFFLLLTRWPVLLLRP